MRKIILALAVAGLCAVAFHAVADETAKKADETATKAADAGVKKEAPKAETLSGEIVDTNCYLAHGARGEKHTSCAAKCISSGTPMGLLTDAGVLYLLTPNHDNPDAYNKLKDMAAKTVAVTGMVMERNGMKGIDVTAYKAPETKTAESK